MSRRQARRNDFHSDEDSDDSHSFEVLDRRSSSYEGAIQKHEQDIEALEMENKKKSKVSKFYNSSRKKFTSAFNT